MDELKRRLAAIGLTDEQVDQAILTVSGFVKEKLPEDYRGMVDDLMAGKSPDLSSVLGKFKSFFG